MEESRTLIITDIHGCYDECRSLLEKMSFDEERDILVNLGDTIDRGPAIYETFVFLRDLKERMGERFILIRGNHDMFWDAKKSDGLNKQFAGRLNFLQNNFYAYEDYALVGTKGHCFEGPFYLDRRGRILGWDEKKEEQSIKLVEREIERLIRSFEDARAAGFRKYLMFLHYPPTNILEDDSPFTKIAEEYGAEQVIYAHSHGESRFHDSIQGEKNGILYSLVSGDYLKWKPKRIL